MKQSLRYVLPAVLLITAFTAGFFVRGQTMHSHMHKPMHRSHHTMGPRFVKKLEQKLSLDPEQTEKVKEIIARRHGEAMRIRKEARPRVKAVQRSAREEIFTVLNEAQKVKFKRMIERHNQRKKKWRKRRQAEWKEQGMTAP